ncbi:MAG: site-2 protease family protein, partial [Anaerolineales bacterium]
MRWSFRLGRVNGVPVEIHWLFALLVAWAALDGWDHGQAAGLLYSTGLLLAVFACILLHEIGHSLQAQALGIAVHRILVMPFGGLAQLSHIPDRPQDELRVAAAGPAVNVGLAVVAGALMLVGLPSVAPA